MGLRDVHKRFHRNERGATAVETALVAAPFIALIIAGLQIALVILSQSALEAATEKSARKIFTGSVQGAGTSQSQFLAQVCAALPSILSNCSNLMVDAQVYGSFASADTSAPTITYNKDGTVSNQWQYNVGTSRDIVVLRVMYLLPVIGGPLNFTLSNAGGGKHLLLATAVFKNEPF